MNLCICHTTLRKICVNESTFPAGLRQRICQSVCESVEDIPVEEMPDFWKKHETDADNFDSRIEAHIRSHSSGDITIFADHPVSNQTRFNCDLAFYRGNDSVCLEIEKGDKARFELDILKMQVFADTELRKTPQRQAYGAFVVPKDNVVASHITGDHRESSYEYLTRLSRLLCEMQSLPLSDILIVGYASGLGSKTEPKKRNRRKSNRQQKDHPIGICPFVRSTFTRLFRENKLSQIMLRNLQDADYSKNTFRMGYPILIRIDPNRPSYEQGRDNRGRSRYWRQEFDNGRYLLCSQWYKRHWDDLMGWLSQFGIDNN